MKVAIINYGMGNLGSVFKAFEDLGAEIFIAEHPDMLYQPDRVILPGVGSFTEGMERLKEHNWDEIIRDVVSKGKPVLGICLGMQMLASIGEEGGESKGLNLIPGRVVRLDKSGCTLKIPHVGWNEVNFKKQDQIFNHIQDHSDFYFVHSYSFVTENSNDLIATASYGMDVAAVIKKNNIIGCQFHPEKSSKAGRQLLKNFLEFTPC